MFSKVQISLSARLSNRRSVRKLVACTSFSCTLTYTIIPTLSLTTHALSPTVTLVRKDPVNTACRTLIKASMGCKDDQSTPQDA